MTIDRRPAWRILRFAVAAALAAGGSAKAASGEATQACPGRPHVTVGGVTGFASLAEPAATSRLRASCKVGLYLHAEAWKVLDDATRARILANFAGTGPEVVELGFVSTPKGYMKNFFKPTFVDKGVAADTALVNGLCHDGADPALGYIDAGRAYGLTTMAPVFAPNSGQFKSGAFDASQFDCVRAASKAGGAIAVDAPPHVFFALKEGYQRFVMDEIRWANKNGLRSYLLLSPNGSGPAFAAESDRMLQMLAAGDARPSDLVFETYDIQRTDAANRVGSERDPDSVVGTTLRLLPKVGR